jgi:hypothetical protein
MLIDSQAQLNSLGASSDSSPALPDPAMNMTAEEHEGLEEYLNAIASATAALADDDLMAYNAALAKIPAPPKGLEVSVPSRAVDLVTARRAFLPVSQAVADYSRQVRGHFPKLRIFRCPMSDQIGAGAPENAKWIQFAAGLRNPYMGKEMLDCGVEVK